MPGWRVICGREKISPLETLGQELYETPATYMLNTDQGLTKTYNHLKDPSVSDPRIEHLRHLHLEMDRAVLAAYGWEVDVPPFTTPTTVTEEKALETFEDEIIDRLFLLNAARAEGEKKQVLAGKTSQPKAPRKVRGGHEGQGKLF